MYKKIKEESERLDELKEKELKLVIGDDINEKLKKLEDAKKKVEEENTLIKELRFQKIIKGRELLIRKYSIFSFLVFKDPAFVKISEIIFSAIVKFLHDFNQIFTSFLN